MFNGLLAVFYQNKRKFQLNTLHSRLDFWTLLFITKYKKSTSLLTYNKQLLNKVDNDIENYQRRGWHYQPKAEVDNANRGFSNCFIMYSKPKKQRTIQMEHTKISSQVNSYNIFLMFSRCSNIFKTI